MDKTPSHPGAALIEEETARLFPLGREYWESLRNARIFMTGGTGLFGRWLLPAALYANAQLDLNLSFWLLTRNIKASLQANPRLQNADCVHWVEGNVKEFMFPDINVDYVVHGATTSAYETFHGETSLQKFNTLVDGTRRVLDFACVAKARRVLFLSSGVVYAGMPDDMLAVPEDFYGAPDTADPRTGLGQAKRAAEYLCAEYAHQFGFELAIARCFSFAGPGLPTDLHYAFGNFIQQALQAEHIVVQGDGTPLRSFLYLGDLVNWLLPLLTRPLPHTLYNVGSDHAVSIGELATYVRDGVAPSKPVDILGRPAYSIGNAPRNVYVPDVRRIQQDFGVRVATPLADIIRHIAEYERRMNSVIWLAP